MVVDYDVILCCDVFFWSLFCLPFQMSFSAEESVGRQQGHTGIFGTAP